MGFQYIPQSYSSIIKRSLSRLGLKKRYVKLRRRSGLPTTDVASGDKIISKVVWYLTCQDLKAKRTSRRYRWDSTGMKSETGTLLHLLFFGVYSKLFWKARI